MWCYATEQALHDHCRTLRQQVSIRQMTLCHAWKLLQSCHTPLIYNKTLFYFRGTENTPELFTVTLGSTKVDPPSAGSVTYNVTRIILHPDYTDIFSGSDIALLFIEQEIKFTQYIKPACLPDLSDIYSSRSYCYTTGWGVQLLNPETYPNILQEAKYKFLDMANCNQSWINAEPSVPISDKMLCAGK